MASPNPDPLSPADRWLAVPVAGPRLRVSAADALAARVRLVLETRPGDLPWSPEFGCALGEFVGKPVTRDRLSEVSNTVATALRRCKWCAARRMRGPMVSRCEVRLLTDLGAGPGDAVTLPLAERALVPFSLSATLEVDLELQTAEGLLTMQAILSP